MSRSQDEFICDVQDILEEEARENGLWGVPDLIYSPMAPFFQRYRNAHLTMTPKEAVDMMKFPLPV